ncbi:5-(carboxyamino)imidazole ribonucleotide synthase [Sandaracinobacteroides saxicola]|nr:5-(carboxyamino)imidazole ribonucleotide synthase [Sandaracinobacteroides saxicola]
MLALAAAPLGYRVHVYAPDAELVAGDVAAAVTRAAWDDAAALDRFAAAVDVITYEFENVPVATVERLAALKPVRPGVAALRVAQDRMIEKRFVAGLGGRPAPFAAVDSLAGLHAALADVGTPAILKTRRLGYDGKGQVRIGSADEAGAAWAAVAGAPCVLEGYVAFAAEFSILVARCPGGAEVHYPAAENVHRGGILSESHVPAGAAVAACMAEATALTVRIADALDYVGVLACEFFACAEGPLFNEMAPRVHNSGHWTQDGALTSQFEQHVRAICGLPLGPVTMRVPRVRMENLLGDTADRWPALLADPAAKLHLYGKSEAAEGRKMGHVNFL